MIATGSAMMFAQAAAPSRLPLKAMISEVTASKTSAEAVQSRLGTTSMMSRGHKLRKVPERVSLICHVCLVTSTLTTNPDAAGGMTPWGEAA